MIVGYGETYAEALLDAEIKLAAFKALDTAGKGFAAVVVAMLVLCWHSLIRPVSGIVLMIGLPLIFKLMLMLAFTLAGWFHGNVAVSIMIILAASIGILAAFVKFVDHIQKIVQTLELWEARGLCWLMENQPAIGRLLHIALYGFTLLVTMGVPIYELNEVGPILIPGVTLAGILVGLACSAYALWLRYREHPFARHLTLMGDLKSAQAV